MRLFDMDSKEDYLLDGKYKVATPYAPLVDVVEVVRCKDCKFAHMTYGGECKYCDVWESEASKVCLDSDFFCAFGERKDDDTD